MPSPAPSPPGTGGSLVSRPFVLVTVATLAYFVAIGALLPTLPRYVAGPLGGSAATVGLVVGAFGFTAVLLRPVVGRIGDRRGRRLLIVAGALAVTASVAGYPLATNAVVLVVLRLLTGAGEAAFFVGAATVVHDLAPDERRGEALSLFSLALYGGIALGPVLGEQLLVIGTFTTVAIAAAGSALLAGLLGAFVPETRAEGSIAPDAAPLLHRDALRPGMVIFTSVFGQAAFHSFVALHADQIGLRGASIAFVIFSVLILGIRSVGAQLPDRLGYVRAARGALGFNTVGLVVIGGFATAEGLYIGTALFAIGQALAFPALMSLATEGVPKSERGSVVGTFTAFVDLAFAIGGVVLGLVASATGIPGAFIGAAVLSLGGLLLITRRDPMARGTRRERTELPHPNI
jgi:MFS family permease